MVFNGLHLLAIIALVVVANVAHATYKWRQRVEYRRVERLVERNLARQSGWLT